MEKIFDTHVHLSEHRDDALIRFARMNNLSYTLNELLSAMRGHNVTRGLLLSPPLQGTTCLSNEEIVKLCTKSTGMLSPVVTVEPSDKKVDTAIKLAEENQREVKAFKIRLGYVNASAESHVFDRVYDYAEAEGLPVLFHTGDTAFSNGDLAHSHPLTLDGLANERDNMSIVLCHFGNPWFDDVAELIYKHPNVYTDTSGLTTGENAYREKYAKWLAEKISGAIYYAGSAEKVLFGTDYPVSRHSDALELIRRLDIDYRDKEKILWDNAEKLFNL